MTKALSKIGFYLIVVLVILYCLAPFAWQILTSFKYDRDINLIPPLIPDRLTIEHYINVLTFKDFGNYIRNSVIVSVMTTLISLVLGAFCAYALARLRFRGKGGVMIFTLASSMFPQIAIVSTLYLAFRSLGMINTFSPMILSNLTFTLPLAIWIMTGFFKSIPASLEEAAMIDGCNRLQVLFRVFLPLAAPGMFTCAILVFIMSWNEFLFAITFTTTAKSQTIPVGIAFFPQLYHVPWGDLAAATIIVTIPLIVLVFIFQKRIIYGLTAGAVKE